MNILPALVVRAVLAVSVLLIVTAVGGGSFVVRCRRFQSPLGEREMERAREEERERERKRGRRRINYRVMILKAQSR